MSGPSPIVSVRDLQLADGHVVDPQQRRAAAREPEQALEADREVEVAARVQAALARTPRRRESSPSRSCSQVSASVPITTSGSRLLRSGPHAGAERGAADLPAAADVARAGRGRWRRSPARRRGSGPGASGRPPRPGPKGPASRGNLPRGGRIRSGACPTSLCTTPEPAPCSPSSRATRRRWGSTPAGRRSTRACTSATRGRSSSSPSSSASSSTRATA